MTESKNAITKFRRKKTHENKEIKCIKPIYNLLGYINLTTLVEKKN